jgi:hypothetical protein
VKERVAARVWHVVCDKLLHIAVPLLAIIGWPAQVWLPDRRPPTGRCDRVGPASRPELTFNSTVQPS